MDQSRSYKIVIVAPTCFYYQVPLFQELNNHPNIDLTVYFCSDEGISGQDVKTVYGSDEGWEIVGKPLIGYKYIFLPNQSPRGSYLKSLVGLANFRVWNQLKQDQPDAVVIMSWMNPTWWLAFLACVRFRFPVFFMTDANFSAENSKSFLRSTIKRILLGKLLFPATSGFLCAGTENQRLYSHYGVQSKKLISFAYSWGYSTLISEADRLQGEKIALRQQFGLPLDAIIILYCGRLSPEKGSIELIEAYNEISSPNKALLLVGDGPLRQRMGTIAELHNLESIYFMGFQNRNNIAKFYMMSDMLVLPSHRETWGLVVNEALCFSLPVVVSDQVGAGVDLVNPGENGYVFHAGDVTDLSTQISKLFDMSDEHRKAMGKKSLDLITEWSNRDLATPFIKYLDEVNQN